MREIVDEEREWEEVKVSKVEEWKLLRRQQAWDHVSWEWQAIWERARVSLRRQYKKGEVRDSLWPWARF